MRRNKFKLLISILIAVVIIAIACIAIIFVGRKTLNDKQEQIDTLEYEIEANKQVVYVTMSDVKAGETLVEGTNVMRQEIYTGLESEYYMQEDMLGGVATLDIKELSPIMANMVTALEITTDTREYEIAVANLMTDQTELDYVDVRIMFPSGEDYLVLSHKPMKNLILDNCIWYTYLNEDEILRMASATVDAFTVTGTYIYTTRYIEPVLQKDAVPNYPVRSECIDLVNSDPNILAIAKDTLNLEARMNLEGRLKGLSQDELRAVSEGHAIEDTARASALLGVDYVPMVEETNDEFDYNNSNNSEDAPTEPNEDVSSIFGE